MNREMRAAEKVWEALNPVRTSYYGYRQYPNGDDLRRTLEAVKQAGFTLQ